MKRLFTILTAVFAFLTVSAQVEHSIILDQSTFRAVQKDALTGVNVDPIARDMSRNACARLKIRFANMSKEVIDALVVKFRSNTDLAKQKVADYHDNILILEMTAQPNTRFYIKSPDYGESNEITLNLEGNKEYQMEARLNQVFSIVVNSNAEGAEVYIDNNYKGRIGANMSLTISDVMIGAHILKVSYGSASSEQKIEVNKSHISFRQDVDTAVSEPQFVVFTVNPNNAVVTIDGKHYPLQDGSMSTVLASGAYNYTVTAVGYHSQNGTFTVAGETVNRNITLKADAANVTITAPDNAEIWINGAKTGEGRWSGTLTSGAYIFEARKAGHRTTKLSKQITSTQPQQSYTLPAPTPIVGTVVIASTPVGANVTIDNKVVGITPMKLDKVFVGNHTLKLSKSGYGDYSQTITVAEGKTATINATLTKGAANGISSKIGDIEMVFVKGGMFTMGATSEQGSDADSDETPTHSVTLSDFYIGKYEVTQAQWRAVMGNNPSYFKGDNLPVECVSWNDIQKFIKKLNAQTGKNFRLPTEAEWEYAARGGNQSRGYKYSGSNDRNNAWYKDNSSSKTHPVGQKQPNELGIYDMSGNVWEWCQDWYGSYSSSSQTNPTGPSSGSIRVLRGGGWGIFARNCRVSYRSYYSPVFSRDNYGFRLVCSPE
ncbi:MAG: SUMF1/EgtB/PvdO family nonheme iron enzyme [Alistipes sp.]|nr:SUMF1/EgtB/PvdO family nonheme iron enzyme [Alistipes sp.]